jgi:hypothetical protein
MYLSQVKRRNLKFVHLYLKDVYTVTLFRIAGKPYTDTKFRVGLSKDGFPSMVPWELRSKILTSRLTAVTVLTILAIYRIVPWWPKVDISTIINPFNGTSRTLDPTALSGAVSGILSIVGVKKLYASSPKFIDSRSSSPNGKVAVEQSIFDAFAFYSNPGKLWSLLYLLVILGGWVQIATLLLILCVGWPLYLRYLWLGKSFYLGKLAVVRDVSGKSRVVGVTNYWIQVCLKPVHDALLSALAALPCDGTFDQLAPVNRLVARGGSFSSFDLSAATDRLPLDVQEQVMGFLFGKRFASLWSDLLRIPFLYNSSLVSYSVGQPMGAYSSWASLAITHHVLLYMVGARDNYAVLGDDVVMSSEIGPEYLSLMKVLGVSISLSKSIEDSSFIEFAKRLIHPSGDYSVIGPGLILNSLLRKPMLVTVLAEVRKRAHLDDWALRVKIESLKEKRIPLLSDFGLHALFGPFGLIEKNAVSVLCDREYGCSYSHLWSDDPFDLGLAHIVRLLDLKWLRSKERAWIDCSRYLSYWGSRLPGIWNIFYSILLLATPSFWVPLLGLARRIVSLQPTWRLDADYIDENLSQVLPKQLDQMTRSDTVDMLSAFKDLRIIRKLSGMARPILSDPGYSPTYKIIQTCPGHIRYHAVLSSKERNILDRLDRLYPIGYNLFTVKAEENL